jgi:hypothetical protein
MDLGDEVLGEAMGSAVVEVAGVAEVVFGEVVVARLVDVLKPDVGELLVELAKAIHDEGVVLAAGAVGIASFALAGEGMGGRGEEQDADAFLIEDTGG